MASGEGVRDFELEDVTPLSDCKELGRRAHVKVYTVKYRQTVCAAKEILIQDLGEAERRLTIDLFLLECRQCSMLRHPNIIQFLGVYYPPSGVVGGANSLQVPAMVMEMMADSLTSFVEKHEKIPVHIKYTIVHDVSLGLCYLHNHDPPIVHRHLSPNKVLLTAHHVAKISYLGVAKVIKDDSRKIMTTIDFMPPESLANSPVYGPPMDVFSFAGIILHTFNQQWPRPTESNQFDPKTRKKIAFLEVERRQQYLDKMTGEAEVLRRLVEECLDDDPAERPTIATVCERIQVNKDVYMKNTPQDLFQQNQRFRDEISQLKNENSQLKNENEQLEKMLSTRSIPAQQVTGVTSEDGPRSKSKTAPPLIPALASGKYCMKWTQLADLPAPLYNVFVAVQHHKIYVTGDSPGEYAQNQVYVYDINTDQWDQLPPSGHYYGIPHIIGGKLVIIGGRLSVTKKITNKVSTFDEDSQTWTSYYPDLLSVRSKLGVVSYLEHVIVAGGVLDDTPVLQDDIEVLNWIEKSSWVKATITLPEPMWNFTPVIFDEHMLIVGFKDEKMRDDASAYKIPVADITASINQESNSNALIKWTKLTSADHWVATILLSLSPPVLFGGRDHSSKGGASTQDIKMYDNSAKSWKKIGSLSSARCTAAAVAVYDNAVLIIGGCTKGDSLHNREISSVKIVELGQAELCH